MDRLDHVYVYFNTGISMNKGRCPRGDLPVYLPCRFYPQIKCCIEVNLPGIANSTFIFDCDLGVKGQGQS